MFDAVTCTIPGAKTPAQAEENAHAADLPGLATATMDAIRAVYESNIREHVHHIW
jgi:aryl-alcohol dehydrogenase-like predicted oxidoreductase